MFEICRNVLLFTTVVIVITHFRTELVSADTTFTQLDEPHLPFHESYNVASADDFEFARMRVVSNNGTWVQRLSAEDIFSGKAPKRMPPVVLQVDAEKFGSKAEEVSVQETEVSKSAWISEVLSDKLANFRARSKSNPLCNEQSDLFEQNLRNLTLWAVQMREASARSAEGLLFGSTFQMGHYDECLAIQTPMVTGRYCLATIQFAPTMRLHPNFYGKKLEGLTVPLDSHVWETVKASTHPAREKRDRLQWAVCIPSACSWEDVENSLTETLADVQREHNIFVNVSLSDRVCSSRADEKPLPQSYTFLTRLLLGLTIFVVAVTIFHWIMINSKPDYEGGTFWKLLIGFSMVRSFRSLTHSGGDTNLNGLDGIKFLSMILLIYGHRVMFAYGSPRINIATYEPDWDGPTLTMVSTHMVDTFFTISGFLIFFLMYPQFKKNGAKIIPFTLFYRWLRVMPAYMMLLAFVITVFPYIEEGPVWKTLVMREVDRCQENWWTNLLVINNYVNTDRACTIHGWYLACDLQFFAVGVFIVYAFSKSHSLGLKILTACLFTSWIIPAVITYVNGLDGILLTYTSLLADPVSTSHYRDFYVKSYNRAGPYFLGILSGYAVMVIQEKKWRIPMTLRWVLLVILAVLGEGTQLYGWNFYDRAREVSYVENAFFAAFHRSIWSILACFIIICYLCWGFGDTVEYILTHSFYVPMSRLTYSAFLVHPFIQLWTTASVRNPEYLTFFKMTWMSAGDILSAYVLAFWLYSTVEGPVGNISVMLKERIMSKKKTLLTEKIIPGRLDSTEEEKKTINREYDVPKLITKETVYYGLNNSKSNGTSGLKKDPDQEKGGPLEFENPGFMKFVKPEESKESGDCVNGNSTCSTGNGPCVKDYPKELSEKLESMLTPS